MSSTVRIFARAVPILLTSIPAAPNFRSSNVSNTVILVVLHASVTDKKGKCRKDFDKDAFNVYENGQAQHLKIFEHEDVPVSLGIVVDNSASMAPKRRQLWR